MTSNLLSYASPWNSSNDTFSKKKGTMPHLIPSVPDEKSDASFHPSSDESTNNTPYTLKSMKETQEENKAKINRVEAFLSQMNSVNLDNDGQSLANFSPLIAPPTLDTLKVPPTQFETPVYYDTKNDSKTASYDKSYSSELPSYYYPTQKPSQRNDNESNRILIEKMNYMIYLLEQQQHEKTDNITEEFFLYIFLGVFIIYVVDSFTKTGKYVR